MCFTVALSVFHCRSFRVSLSRFPCFTVALWSIIRYEFGIYDLR